MNRVILTLETLSDKYRVSARYTNALYNNLCKSFDYCDDVQTKRTIYRVISELEEKGSVNETIVTT